MKTLLRLAAVIAIWTAAGAEQKAEFEVATVKLSQPVPPGVPININIGTIRNGTVTLTNTTLGDCLQFAYNIVSNSQIIGPDWIKNGDVRFDVVAKAAPDTPREQLLIMLQNLLAERLKLGLHHDKRELPFLALTIGRNGPKLAPARETTDAARTGAGRISAPRMPMSILAALLSRFERQIVVDQTNLTGPYSIDLSWTTDAIRQRAPQDGTPLVVNGQTIDTNGPSLYVAIQEQLGLRLDSRKGPVDVLVVDQAEKVPIDN